MYENSCLPAKSLSSRASSHISLSAPSTPFSESCLSLSTVATPATEVSALFGNAQSSSSFNESSGDDFILVVGGLGYIGSHTSWELLKAGQNVIIIDNLSNSNLDVFHKLRSLRNRHFKTRRSRPLLDFFKADYRDQQQLRPILTRYGNPLASHVESSQSTISGVIHFAAYKSVGESFEKPLEYYANNVGGMIDFCTTLAEFNIKTFIFSSSATVYGSLASKEGRFVEKQCDRSSCVGLTNPYGRTKWMCEAILNDLAASDPSWTIMALRYFNPIGCDPSGLLGEDPRDTPNNLMPIVIKAMMGESPALNIFGTDWDTPDGTAIRDFIHVSDLANGHLAALKAAKSFTSGYHTFNLGTGSGHSVKNVINAMEQASGRTVPIKVSGRRKGDIGVCVAESSKSAVMLGWKAERTLNDACEDICRYLKLNDTGGISA
ncbi:hypothetical protein B7463_g8367, partial [Scytalidium lignicola]